MNLWELTFKQYREYKLDTNKYKDKYLENPDAWDFKEVEHMIEWENILLERAKIGIIPSKVFQSYIRVFGEQRMFSKFRGVHSEGIKKFRIPHKK
jgi:hypothetical protein